MIEFLSFWARGLGLAIVVVSILEMLLPNNKTKKYIRAIMGIYILFTMISPLIKNKKIFDVNNLNFENYVSIETSSSLNSNKMSNNIQELYIEEIQKDITNKLKEKGFEVMSCRVNAQIINEENQTKINKIILNFKKNNNVKQKESLENKIVTEVQKIKPITSEVKLNQNSVSLNNSNENNLSESDIQNIKKFLIEEYEVSEKCLEIN